MLSSIIRDLTSYRLGLYSFYYLFRTDLKRHIPSFSGTLETSGKLRVLQLLFKIFIEIRLFHRSTLFIQSRIRSRAAAISRY
jgi:hypothetical protein